MNVATSITSFIKIPNYMNYKEEIEVTDNTLNMCIDIIRDNNTGTMKGTVHSETSLYKDTS